MVILVQGLIILFCGAMENLYAPAIAKMLKLKK
jgi:simple sugar transport system permease protein